ncbi:helix-turn-helix domain-containing protein [Enterococcus sp. AD013-P3]|uniref:helix-turn-helix domain-containing protein n=1 Tax=Enterococcus sp. AD013-P3 TaxID=3411036 RepID=UPI003B94093C
MVEISEERLAELENYEWKVKKDKRNIIERKLERIDTSTIGGRVKFLRIKRGLTLKELSEKSGIFASNINLMELGKRKISFEKVIKLCEGLEVRVEEVDPYLIDEIRRINSNAKKD